MNGDTKGIWLSVHFVRGELFVGRPDVRNSQEKSE